MKYVIKETLYTIEIKASELLIIIDALNQLSGESPVSGNAMELFISMSEVLDEKLR